jgi:small subunit ribosomal protein S21
VRLTGRTVQVNDGNVDRALRKFKKKIQASGLLQDLKDREHYVKPTTQRKKDRDLAKNRWRKKLAAQALPKKLF